MSSFDPVDTPMKRFSTFWLWLVVVSFFGILLCVSAPWLKNRDSQVDLAAKKRLEIKNEVEDAQAGMKQKIAEVYPKMKTLLLEGEKPSSKALPAASSPKDAQKEEQTP